MPTGIWIIRACRVKHFTVTYEETASGFVVGAVDQTMAKRVMRDLAIPAPCRIVYVWRRAGK